MRYENRGGYCLVASVRIGNSRPVAAKHLGHVTIAIFQVQRAVQPQAAPRSDGRPAAGPIPLPLIASSVWTWRGIPA